MDGINIIFVYNKCEMETIKRLLEESVTSKILPNKAVLIFGARRVGKTILLRHIIDKFNGKVLLLNGEDFDSISLLEEKSISNYRHILDGVNLLAIDEAQAIPDVGAKLKLIVDEIPGICVLATGSSSFDLFNKAHYFTLHPFHNEKSGKLRMCWKRDKILSQGLYTDLIQRL